MKVAQSGSSSWRDNVVNFREIYFGRGSKWDYYRVGSWCTPIDFSLADKCVRWLSRSRNILAEGERSLFIGQRKNQSSGEANRKTDWLFQNISTGVNTARRFYFHVPPPPTLKPFLPTQDYVTSLNFQADPRSIEIIKSSLSDGTLGLLLKWRCMDCELFNEYPPWYRSAADAIKRMMEPHSQCISHFRAVADYDFSVLPYELGVVWERICPRISNLARFSTKWREDRFQGARREDLNRGWFSEYADLSREFVVRNLVEPVQVTIPIADYSGEIRRMEFTYLRPLYFVRQFCDLLLHASVIEDSWDLFLSEFRKRPSTWRWESPHMPDVWVESGTAEEVRVSLWSRYPFHPPDWELLDVSLDHHREAMEVWKKSVLSVMANRQQRLLNAMNAIANDNSESDGL